MKIETKIKFSLSEEEIKILKFVTITLKQICSNIEGYDECQIEEVADLLKEINKCTTNICEYIE